MATPTTGTNAATKAYVDTAIASVKSKYTSACTANYVSKFTGANAIGNSIIFDNGTNVGIGTTAPNAKLQVAGASIIANNTAIDPDSYGNTVVVGQVADGSGWSATGIGGNGGVGQSWGIGNSGGSLYFAYGNGFSNSLFLTYMQVSNRNVFLVPSSGSVGIGQHAAAISSMSPARATSRARWRTWRRRRRARTPPRRRMSIPRSPVDPARGRSWVRTSTHRTPGITSGSGRAAPTIPS